MWQYSAVGQICEMSANCQIFTRHGRNFVIGWGNGGVPHDHRTSCVRATLPQKQRKQAKINGHHLTSRGRGGKGCSKYVGESTAGATVSGCHGAAARTFAWVDRGCHWMRPAPPAVAGRIWSTATIAGKRASRRRIVKCWTSLNAHRPYFIHFHLKRCPTWLGLEHFHFGRIVAKTIQNIGMGDGRFHPDNHFS